MADRVFSMKDWQGREREVALPVTPDICPCCHKGIEPRYHFGFIEEVAWKVHEAQAVFQCPLADCHRLFIAHYTRADGPHAWETSEYVLQLLSPIKFKGTQFPDAIVGLSPSFCAIFNQAAEAEARALRDVAGPGYRKALEFLIKDFQISREPAEEATIKKMELHNVIQNKVDDANIKRTASRAAWLGNDETHYERRWADKDIEDLKRLIKLTVNWVENCLLTAEYETSMPKPKKS